MKKRIGFDFEKESQINNKIKDTLNAQFPLPDSVEKAKQQAFAEIRERAGGKNQDMENPKQKKQRRVWKIVGGTVAAAAALVTVCISNPAWASELPLVGSVFERIGDSLGFSGDFSDYAKPVTEVTSGEEIKQEEDRYAQTSNGVTVKIAETYCNGAALYVSMVIQSEEPIPDTLITQDGKPYIHLEEGTAMPLSFDPEFQLWNCELDGKFLDKYTFAGVLRVDMSHSDKKIPETFTVNLNIQKIIGALPSDQVTTPEMPKELQDQYEQKRKEKGLDQKEYEEYTEEEKELEEQFFQEMYQKYWELYPETIQGPSKYDSWFFEGDWKFTFDVDRNDAEKEIVEVNLLDENGDGITSITRTPFELVLEVSGNNIDYFPVVLDANGELMPLESGPVNVYPIQDRDISKVDVYICDYLEYMDELKGYYWSDDYEQKKQTKTFKQLLDERAIMHKEVILEQ